MAISIFAPKTALLKDLIESIYFIEPPFLDNERSYYSFPSNNTCVSIIKGGSVHHSGNRLFTQISTGIESYLIGNFNTPVKVEYSKSIREVSIVFKPLGLNSFLSLPLSTYSKLLLNEFKPFEDYPGFITGVFESSSQHEVLELIEKYWESKFLGFKHPFIVDIVSKWITDPETGIQDFCKLYGVSNKTIIKHFRSHLGKTPSDFRNILKLQQAIRAKNQLQSGVSLTEIALDSGFFDQAHMIKAFKDLTGKKPSEFYRLVTSLGENNINWLFM